MKVYCETCQKQFTTWPSVVDRGGGRFCSVSCRAVWTSKQMTGEKRPELSEKMKGRRSRHWKGGRITDQRGYVLVWKPKHENANSAGYVREHRLNMSKKLGRSLKPQEVVHHVDGNKQNNKISNLELFKNHSTHLKHEWATVRK